MVVLGQIIVWARAPKPDGLVGHAYMLLMVLPPAILLLVTDAQFRSCRPIVLSVSRILANLLPSQRSTAVRASRRLGHTVCPARAVARPPTSPAHTARCCASPQAGSAGLLLARAPQPGAIGLAVDVVRLLLGMRLLQHGAITLLLPPSPLALAMLTHAAVVLLMRNNGPKGYCSTQVGAAKLAQGCVWEPGGGGGGGGAALHVPSTARRLSAPRAAAAAPSVARSPGRAGIGVGHCCTAAVAGGPCTGLCPAWR